MAQLVTDHEYRAFKQWRAEQEAKQALTEQAEKLKREQQTQRDDFVRNMRVDRELQRGIEAGMPWDAFMRETAAPSDLQERYEQLQAAHAAAEAKKEDLFLDGFNKG